MCRSADRPPVRLAGRATLAARKPLVQAPPVAQAHARGNAIREGESATGNIRWRARRAGPIAPAIVVTGVAALRRELGVIAHRGDQQQRDGQQPNHVDPNHPQKKLIDSSHQG